MNKFDKRIKSHSSNNTAIFQNKCTNQLTKSISQILESLCVTDMNISEDLNRISDRIADLNKLMLTSSNEDSILLNETIHSLYETLAEYLTDFSHQDCSIIFEPYIQSVPINNELNAEYLKSKNLGTFSEDIQICIENMKKSKSIETIIEKLKNNSKISFSKEQWIQIIGNIIIPIVLYFLTSFLTTNETNVVNINCENNCSITINNGAIQNTEQFDPNENNSFEMQNTSHLQNSKDRK